MEDIYQTAKEYLNQANGVFMKEDGAPACEHYVAGLVDGIRIAMLFGLSVPVDTEELGSVLAGAHQHILENTEI